MAITRLESFLTNPNINSKNNDYGARSGWNPDIVLANQFRLGLSEAKALIAAITKECPTDAEKKAVMLELLDRTQDRGDRMGSVALTAGAARELTYFASSVGVVKFFGANNLPPLHPVG